MKPKTSISDNHFLSQSTRPSIKDHSNSNDFDKRFPVLIQELAKLEETTGLKQIKQQIQYLDDDKADTLIDEFYKVKMLAVLEAVNVEVTSVIGPAWSVFCQQSNGAWASHTLLVLWLAINEEFFHDL